MSEDVGGEEILTSLESVEQPKKNGQKKTKRSSSGSQPSGEFRDGDLVFARFNSFPWWPGQVLPRENEHAGKGRKSQVLVKFFGTKWELAWVDNDISKLKALEESDVSGDPPEKRHKKVLDVAYAQAREALEGRLPLGWVEDAPGTPPNPPSPSEKSLTVASLSSQKKSKGKEKDAPKGLVRGSQLHRLRVLQKLGLAPPSSVLKTIKDSKPLTGHLERWAKVNSLSSEKV